MGGGGIIKKLSNICLQYMWKTQNVSYWAGTHMYAVLKGLSKFCWVNLDYYFIYLFFLIQLKIKIKLTSGFMFLATAGFHSELQNNTSQTDWILQAHVETEDFLVHVVFGPLTVPWSNVLMSRFWFGLFSSTNEDAHVVTHILVTHSTLHSWHFITGGSACRLVNAILSSCKC